MTPLAEPQTSTIHGLAHSIVVLPYQLGYRPTASLVLLCMGTVTPVGASSGRVRGSVTLVARVDLPTSGAPESVVAGIEPALSRTDVTSVVALAFEDGPDEVTNAASTLRWVADAAGTHDVSVVASARVRGQRFAAVDEGGRTGTWEDLPADGDVPAIADYVLAGRAPAPDRAAVESVLRPRDAAYASAVRSRMGGYARVRAREAARTISTVISQPDGRALDLEPEEVACVALALHETTVRDAVLSRLSPPLAQPGAPFNVAERQVAHELDVCDRVDGPACFRLAALAAYVPRPQAAPVLTLVGYLAWQAGEGALANMAIAAALDVDPQYSLARLVDVALSSALRPPPPV